MAGRMQFTVSLVLFLTFVICSWARLATIPIDGKLSIPDGSPAAGYQVTLNGNQFFTSSKVDGSFRFHDVPSGIYLLDVLSVHEVFSQLKLKVDASQDSVTVVEYKYPGAKRVSVPYPLSLVAIAPISYFQQRAPINIVGALLGNPMMLMMAFSVGVMFLIPMLTQGMDEEQLKEMQSAEDPMKNLQKLMGMETKTNDDDEDD